MGRYGKILFFLGLQLVSTLCVAQQISVKSLELITTEKQSRMVFDVSASPKHRVFVMNDPSRLVIDIENAQLKGTLNPPPREHPLFAGIRTGIKDKTDLRVVVDLKVPVTAKEFSLKSDNSNEHRLVVDLDSRDSVQSKPAPSVVIAPVIKPSPTETKVAVNKDNGKGHNEPVIIAIDPGHGGNDSGAKGIRGTEEKVITFQIAKKLEAFINAHAGMKAVMVRTDDYYVGLRERMKIARAANAVLFVSIHADAFQDTLIKGASVYTLSTTGASSEAARWLADSENASDMVGVSLHDKEDDLASTLFDLTQKDTREASVNVANHVLKSFMNVSPLHKDTVQKAGFMVLKSPDIPSILVETAFISNPSEEQNLLSEQFQTKIAKAIFKGLVNYFSQSSSSENSIAVLEPLIRG
jgi:N-acetylmuramoyl-L-alanine amidase